LSWSPDGHLLACVQRGRIAFFESDTLKFVTSHEDPYPCFVEFSPDGGLVALGSWEQGTVRPTSSLFAHSDA
jgi:WD40 repeat protein